MRKRKPDAHAALGARRSACPINACLEVFGDPWSLLIVRDLLFFERRRYGEFLAAGEGMATNILADRLRKLARHGIVARRRDPDDARRLVYSLTEKGLDLAPLLVEMIIWAAGYEKTAAPPALVRELRRDREGYLSRLRASLAARAR